MKNKITFFLMVPIFIITMVSFSSKKTEVKEIKYTLEFEDSRYMSFYINNNSDKEIKLEYPTTHTFNFRLIKDGNVVWDSFKDYKTVAKEDWKTTLTIKANEKLEQIIWYENIDKDLSGEYEYEFYSTNDNLKDVPHLTGTLEFLKDKYEIDRVRLIE